MKKIILSIGMSFCLIFLFANIQPTVAACNEGHYSNGNQSFGGPNGRWELVCDTSHAAVCCISHPPAEQ